MRDFNDFPWTKKSSREKIKGILWNANIERDRKERPTSLTFLNDRRGQQKRIYSNCTIYFVCCWAWQDVKNIDDSHKWQEWRDLNTGLILAISEEGEQECLTRRRTRGKGRIYNSNEIEIIQWLQAYVCRYVNQVYG